MLTFQILAKKCCNRHYTVRHTGIRSFVRSFVLSLRNQLKTNEPRLGTRKFHFLFRLARRGPRRCLFPVVPRFASDYNAPHAALVLYTALSRVRVRDLSAFTRRRFPYQIFIFPLRGDHRTRRHAVNPSEFEGSRFVVNGIGGEFLGINLLFILFYFISFFFSFYFILFRFISFYFILFNSI